MVFSQPSTNGHHTADAGTGTLISMAAQLAHALGDIDSIRAQLLPHQQPTFDMAYEVQGMQAQQAQTEKRRRITLRTEEAAEKARATKNAAELLAAEEKAALYAATDADADTFGEVLGSMELDTLPEPETLIEGFLNKRTLIRLFGPPKSYKSFVMLDMAGCVGTGMKWLGKETAQAKVLYIVAEGAQGIKRRVRAWEAQNKRRMDGVHFYPRAVQIARHEEMRPLVAFAKRGGYKLIIFDTQARCTVGIEENNPTAQGLVIAALDSLKEITGACVALVHHSGVTGGRARGSTAILGAVDAEFEVEKEPNMSVKLTTKAQKDLAEAPEVLMDLVTPGPGLSLAIKPRMSWYRARPEDLPPLPPIERAVLTALDGFGAMGATMTVLEKDLSGHDPLDLRRALGALDQKGCIRTKGATVYVGDKGRTYLRAAQATGDDDD